MVFTSIINNISHPVLEEYEVNSYNSSADQTSINSKEDANVLSKQTSIPIASPQVTEQLIPKPSIEPIIKKYEYSATIAFTFDDGYHSDYDIAYSILKEYGICGTSYIIPEYLDSNTPNALTWDQVKEMDEYGWAFGCHTYTHSNLTKMTKNEIQSSMQKVNESFIKQGLEPPIIHAFPYGKYDQQAIDAMKPYRVQMRKAFYEHHLIDVNNVNPYEVDSISADMRTEKRLNKHKADVDRACKEKSIIVFRCHCLYKNHVDDMGDWPVQTDGRLFRELVQYCVDKDCRFITMIELIDMYENTECDDAA